MRYVSSGLAVLALHLQLCAAHAADPALKCRIGELKAAAKYGTCRAGAENTALKAGLTPDFSKCVTKFATKWDQLESKGACPSTDSYRVVEPRITEHVTQLFELLSNEPSIVCAFPATGLTTSFGAGDDGDVQSGSPLAYQNNGDGTITDLNTGLMWEMKNAPFGQDSVIHCTSDTGACANAHDVRLRYSWSVGFDQYNGSLVNVFLQQLNNRCEADATRVCVTDGDCTSVGGGCGFAGHQDWRIPNQKELYMIADYAGPQVTGNRTIHPIFYTESLCIRGSCPTPFACSCTADTYHWSSTTYRLNSTQAWQLDFSFAGGIAQTVSKLTFGAARAVRGAL